MQEKIRAQIHGLGDRILETNRLYCRPLIEDDLPLIKGIYADKVARIMLAHEPPQAGEEVMSLRRFMEAYRENGLATYAICKKNDQVAIGIAGFGCRDKDHPSELTIHYTLLADNRGKGYGIEVAKGLAGLAFNTLGATNLLAQTLSYNTDSQKLLGRLGMFPDGVQPSKNYKDEYCTVYSMTKGQYKEWAGLGINADRPPVHEKARNFFALIEQDKKSAAPTEDMIKRAANYRELCALEKSDFGRRFKY